MTMEQTLIGPVQGGARGWAFGASEEDVTAVGYVEEEFFLEGTAIGYEAMPGTEIGIDGRWEVRPAASAPFRTRVLVLRPSDASRFNGTVLVNWQNVTAGFELATTVSADVMATGCAQVSVSAQRASVHGTRQTERWALRAWDPQRYGDLHHPGDDYSYDIFTQAARAVPQLMDGLPVARLLATGASQSAMRLRSYMNAVHPFDPVFAGFFPTVDFGIGALIDTRDMSFGHRSQPSVVTRIRDDLDVPVMIVNSETEAVPMFPVRQPDTDRFRFWEVAGTAHVAGRSPLAEGRLRLLERDGISLGAQLFGVAADGDPANELSYYDVQRAAMDHMLRWVATGTPPPSQPLIEIEPGEPPTIRRDQDGNALGGIRIPDLVLPTGQHCGARPGNVFQSLPGFTRRFPPDQLKARYPSVEAYVKAYARAVDDGVAAGFLRAEDAPQLKATGAGIAAERITW
jgi:hypothetical protein